MFHYFLKSELSDSHSAEPLTCLILCFHSPHTDPVEEWLLLFLSVVLVFPKMMLERIRKFSSLESSFWGLDSQVRQTHPKVIITYHRLHGHGSEQAPGGGDGQGSLACCGPWGSQRVGHD